MYLDLPELGVIPSDSLGPRLRVRLVGSKASANKEQLLQSPGSELPQRVELVTWQRKPSMVAILSGSLVSILFSGENGTVPARSWSPVAVPPKASRQW